MKNPNHSFPAVCKAAAIAVSVFLFQNAHAQLFQEGFNYTAGGNLGGNAPWTSGNNNITIGNGSLNYPGLTSLGGNDLSVVSGVSAGSVVANFTGTPITSGSVYYSFLAQCSSLPTANQYLTALLPASASGPNGSSDPLGFYVGQQTAGSTFKVGVRSGGSGATYTTSSTLTVGKVNLFVVQYTFDGNVSLWVNPTAGGSEPTADISFAAGVSAANLQEIGFKSQSAATAGNWFFDDLRVGTSWADVTPVPEPSVFALAGLGLLGLMTRFRNVKR
jgi:hypothetical protein